MQVFVNDFRIVDFGCRRKNRHDQLADCANEEVAFVTVMHFLSFLCPAGIDILMAFLTGLVVPECVAFALLDDGVLLPGVTLFWCLDKT